ncbi:splicing factor 3B subunit 10 [Ancylostoma ceylanicum]|uniref:Splicing factor 3B subunit 10 n=1 Tax=Ancylostoma ceylanicum TaxID=53326 RepID=A0A0D6LAY3_9BILA|nr:splicing factor 3B subunit 10 [Ancylostoma ceylanicum]
MSGPGERFHVLAQLDHLHSKYTGTGHADTTRYEWLTNQLRDTRASQSKDRMLGPNLAVDLQDNYKKRCLKGCKAPSSMSHPGMTSFIAIVENESRARTRYNLLNRMILPCGPPPEKSPLDD